MLRNKLKQVFVIGLLCLVLQILLLQQNSREFSLLKNEALYYFIIRRLRPSETCSPFWDNCDVNGKYVFIISLLLVTALTASPAQSHIRDENRRNPMNDSYY